MAEYTWKDYYARALALAESLVAVASEEPPPSDAALRDEVCMAHAVVAADIIIERLERERDDAVRFRDEWQRVYFELIKAIGSSPASSKPPVSVALELRAKLDTLTKELEVARKVCATATCINQGYKNGVYEIAARDKPEHELAEAFFASLDRELSAYRAMQTKEPRDEKAK